MKMRHQNQNKKSAKIGIQLLQLIWIVIGLFLFTNSGFAIERTVHSPIKPLNGKWQFYWNQLLTPEDFRGERGKERIARADHISVPSNWHGQILGEQTNGGLALPQFGYATYRYTETLKPEQVNQPMAVYFRYVDAAASTMRESIA